MSKRILEFIETNWDDIVRRYAWVQDLIPDYMTVEDIVQDFYLHMMTKTDQDLQEGEDPWNWIRTIIVKDIAANHNRNEHGRGDRSMKPEGYSEELEPLVWDEKIGRVKGYRGFKSLVDFFPPKEDGEPELELDLAGGLEWGVERDPLETPALPDAVRAHVEQMTLVNRFMAELPDDQIKIIAMLYGFVVPQRKDGVHRKRGVFTVEEIMVEVGQPKRTVWRNRDRALTFLREKMEEANACK